MPPATHVGCSHVSLHAAAPSRGGPAYARSRRALGRGGRGQDGLEGPPATACGARPSLLCWSLGTPVFSPANRHLADLNPYLIPAQTGGGIRRRQVRAVVDPSTSGAARSCARPCTRAFCSPCAPQQRVLGKPCQWLLAANALQTSTHTHTDTFFAHLHARALVRATPPTQNAHVCAQAMCILRNRIASLSQRPAPTHGAHTHTRTRTRTRSAPQDAASFGLAAAALGRRRLAGPPAGLSFACARALNCLLLCSTVSPGLFVTPRIAPPYMVCFVSLHVSPSPT
jgi:hypothetical protein